MGRRVPPILSSKPGLAVEENYHGQQAGQVRSRTGAGSGQEQVQAAVPEIRRRDARTTTRGGSAGTAGPMQAGAGPGDSPVDLAREGQTRTIGTADPTGEQPGQDGCRAGQAGEAGRQHHRPGSTGGSRPGQAGAGRPEVWRTRSGEGRFAVRPTGGYARIQGGMRLAHSADYPPKGGYPWKCRGGPWTSPWLARGGQQGVTVARGLVCRVPSPFGVGPTNWLLSLIVCPPPCSGLGLV